MTEAQFRILKKIEETDRMLTKDELFDLYTEYGMKSFRHCYLTIDGEKSVDFGLPWLEEKASLWAKYNLGSLLVGGYLGLTLNCRFESDE